jgi:amidase
MDAHSIIQLSAIDLSKAIHARDISCEEVMKAYLAQIHLNNKKVNAIVSLQNDESLLRQAKQMDDRLAKHESLGWMAGFPIAPKDLTATADIPTTLGSPILQTNITRHDSIIVERMKQSGAILIGKTNVPEFGLGSNTYNQVFGATMNAYDHKKTAGGSSGGAAVALAMKMLPVADGSDMGGSLRNPAAWNNIYGMRPSRGRVPLGPSSEVFFEQLGTEGPMARNVQDLAMLLSVQAGYDERSPLSLRDSPCIFTQNLEKNFSGTKIAWLGDFNGYLAMESGLLAALEKNLPYFEQMGCQVEAVVPQFNMEKLWDCWLKLRAFLLAGKLKLFYSDPRYRALMKPEAIWEVEQARSVNCLSLYEASETRTAWAMEMNRLFQTYDYLVLPSTQVFAFDASEHWPKSIDGLAMDTYHRWMEVVIGPTLAGLPVLNVPAGFDLAGVPIGLQIIGKPGIDLSVLQFGAAWQSVTPYLKVEPLFGE